MNVNNRLITTGLGSYTDLREPNKVNITQLLKRERDRNDRQQDARSGNLDTIRQYNNGSFYCEMKSEGVRDIQNKTGKLNSTTDSLSKLCRSGDYTPKQAIIQIICMIWNYMLQIDIFATQENSEDGIENERQGSQASTRQCERLPSGPVADVWRDLLMRYLERITIEEMMKKDAEVIITEVIAIHTRQNNSVSSVKSHKVMTASLLMSVCFFSPNEIAEIRLKFSNDDKTENQASLRLAPKQANAIETYEVYETDNEKLSTKLAIYEWIDRLKKQFPKVISLQLTKILRELKIIGASVYSIRHSATTELANNTISSHLKQEPMTQLGDKQAIQAKIMKDQT
ncbi:MAG: hypothetical protein EZS28_012147 [Streblomastix strix]|uniref:Uncharacterized protein n=1 Tax=Streblomastix strix TaxID=222440 RepID=A0A5J4WCD8_9EUKA|nr:MAG: hypothetical protein EZS28_012147 [Streblomastix strix]